MAIKLVAVFSILLALSQAVKHYGPNPTNPAADHLDPYGWSPKPTLSPGLAGLHGGLRYKRQSQSLINTCAYFNQAPIYCPPNEYCAFNSVLSAFGCCSVDSNGNFLSNCGFPTACVNQAQSSSLCGSFTFDCIGSATVICGEPGHLPECAEYVLPDGTVLDTFLGCYSEATVITVAATPPSPPLITTTSTPISTTTTSSTTTSPSTTITSPSSASTSLMPTPSPSHTGAIAGGVVGGVAVIALVAALIGFVVHRMRVKKREAELGSDSPEMTGNAYTPRG